MSENDYPFDTSTMTELLFEDIRDLSVHNGIFRCTLYAFRVVPPNTEPQWVPVLPLAMPVSAVGPVAGKALAKCGIDAVQGAKEFVRDQVSRLLH